MDTFFNMIRELDEYTPENRHFTTDEEIERISSQLCLNDLDGTGLQNLRDMVVLVYGDRSRRARERADYKEFDRINNAMMSITAVIDLYKIKERVPL